MKEHEKALKRIKHARDDLNSAHTELAEAPDAGSHNSLWRRQKILDALGILDEIVA